MSQAQRDLILDTALRLADTGSWEALRLHQVASALGIGLNDIRVHYREKEALVDAWFDRADRALLERARAADVITLSTRGRLLHALMAWFDALAPHRRVTRQMVLNKLEPGHLHYQYDGALRVSRTVQWWREAAARAAVLPWRALEETALTGIFLAVFGYWMQDDSPHSTRTRALLERMLNQAAQAAAWVPGLRPRAGAAPEVP
mgnify:CR=1 FL=1